MARTAGARRGFDALILALKANPCPCGSCDNRVRCADGLACQGYITYMQKGKFALGGPPTAELHIRIGMPDSDGKK